MTHNDMSLGFIPLARSTFDIELATQVMTEVRRRLERAGFSLAGPNSLISDVEETAEAARELAGRPLDLLLVLQTTFADTTMVMQLTKEIDAPFLLWAVPEQRTGGRLRLNSLCGINLAAHALKRAGYYYDYVYAPPDDPAAMEQVDTLARAGRVRRLLRQTRIGRVGEHPTGFETCSFDADALKRQLGLDVVEVELEQAFQSIRDIDPRETETVLERLSGEIDGLQQLDQAAVRGTLSAYVTLRQIAEQKRLNGLAVRCWPEFFTEMGCAACGAMSMLSDEMTPCSCEADLNGTITQFILQELSGTPAFGSDLVSVDVEEDTAVLWHCGLAPLSMADPTVQPSGTIHSNRELPLLMEFPLKPGRVTVARLSEATGDYRLVVGNGEILRASPSFSGTSGVLRFDRPAAEVLDTIMSEGLEHHVCLTYGDCAPALFALGEMLELPVLRL